MAEDYCITPANVTPGRARRESCPPFLADEMVHCGTAVARGLAYLHEEQQLLHGDVKSSNVLVSRDLAVVKICDLGVSLHLAQDLCAVVDRKSVV